MKTEKLGMRIQRYMEHKGMTIDDLALQTGLDASFLSSLQDNDVYPSLGPLLKIARALGLRLGTFLDDQIGQDPLIVRAHDRQPELVTHKGTDRPPSHLFHSLGRGKVDRHMEPFFIEILPEHDEERRLSSHEGEEFIVVVCGTIEVITALKHISSKLGDSIYYNSVVPHYVSSANGEGARYMRCSICRSRMSMPRTEPLREMTLGDMLDETIEAYPDNEAIVYVDRDFASPTRSLGKSSITWRRGSWPSVSLRGRKSPHGPRISTTGWHFSLPLQRSGPSF